MDDLVQESLRPIGARGPEECFRLSFFHNASSIHEDDPTGDLAGEAHFIGDTPCSVLSLARSASSARALAATSSLGEDVINGEHVTTAGFGGGSDMCIDDERLMVNVWGVTPSPRPRLRPRGKA